MKHIWHFGTAFVLSTLSFTVHAAGFALANQSGSGAGNAYAGGAAAAEDASVVWYNPAAMTELPAGTHASIAGHVVAPKAQFTNNGSLNPPGLGTKITGDNDDGGKVGVVPNAYLVKGKGQKWRFGVGLNAPFGLGTKYDENWVGRYHALESDIQTINFNPSLAYKVNDRFSVGAGVSVQQMKVELQSAVDSRSLCLAARITPSVCATLPDGKVKVEGDNVRAGYNVGVLFKPSEKTRIGASYRSRMKQNLEGTAEFNVPPALSASPLLAGGDVTALADLPAHFSLSVAHKINQRLELLGDVTRTRWSSFKTLQVTRTSGSDVTNLPQNWKDVNRYSIGTNYQYNDRWKLKAGIAYDETPVPDAEHRSPRTPDGNRTWLSFGANYKPRKNFSVDMGYTHIFVKDTPINNKNNIDATRAHTLIGSYDSSVDIISAQFNWSF
ncbi:OmpP1/FadL family transporter [Thiofilum flexile]|uniref:OmpP1/FadL family transporter n=1 Tax=Thiofilum flexile TaxID=125627 RepID=UPI000375B844|nr:outer membrane protein transport protein [Thiofilum flexile]